MSSDEIKKRIEENQAISKRNAEHARRMERKYHTVFNTKEGKDVLDDMKRKAGGVEVIDFDAVGEPFSSPRFFVRQGFRQAIGWILLNMNTHQERLDIEDE